MRKILKWCGAFFGASLLVAAAVVAYAWHYYHNPGPSRDTINVVFEQGTPFKHIVASLFESGVINQPLLFRGVVIALGEAGKFKAGEYEFAPRITPEKVAQQISGGKVVVHKLTIPEGVHAQDVAEVLGNTPLLQGALHNAISEGSILPETYYYHRGETRSSLIARMQSDLQKFLDAQWETRAANLPFKTKEEALILASIIEKETGYKGERKKVAAVFVNRLRKGMPLQSDPTVTYGIEFATGQPLGRKLSRLDLKTPTEYNTYKISGLPPTPIALAGKKAIRAALHPATSKDLYFVATGSGGHNFATNLKDHNRNVAQYRRMMRAKK